MAIYLKLGKPPKLSVIKAHFLLVETTGFDRTVNMWWGWIIRVGHFSNREVFCEGGKAESMKCPISSYVALIAQFYNFHLVDIIKKLD